MPKGRVAARADGMFSARRRRRPVQNGTLVPASGPLVARRGPLAPASGLLVGRANRRPPRNGEGLPGASPASPTEKNAPPTGKSTPFPEKPPPAPPGSTPTTAKRPNPKSNRLFVPFAPSWFPQHPVVPAADSNMEMRSDIGGNESTVPAKRVSPIYWALLPTAARAKRHQQLRQRHPKRPRHLPQHNERRHRSPRLDPPHHLPRQPRSHLHLIHRQPPRLPLHAQPLHHPQKNPLRILMRLPPPPQLRLCSRLRQRPPLPC